MVTGIHTVEHIVIITRGLGLFTLSLDGLRGGQGRIHFEVIVFTSQTIQLNANGIRMTRDGRFSAMYLVHPARSFFRRRLTFTM